MSLTLAFKDNRTPLRIKDNPEGDCIIVCSLGKGPYGRCAMSKDSAKQLAEALLEFANMELDL